MWKCTSRAFLDNWKFLVLMFSVTRKLTWTQSSVMFEFFVEIIITWTNLKPKLFSPFEVSSSSCVFLSYSLPRLWKLYLIQPFFLHPSDLWSMKNYAVSISISYKSLFVFISIFVFCHILLYAYYGVFSVHAQLCVFKKNNYAWFSFVYCFCGSVHISHIPQDWPEQ